MFGLVSSKPVLYFYKVCGSDEGLFLWFTGIVVLALASPILNNIDRYSPSFSENRNPKIYTLHTSVQFEEFIGVIEGKQMRLIIPAWCTFSK